MLIVKKCAVTMLPSHITRQLAPNSYPPLYVHIPSVFFFVLRLYGLIYYFACVTSRSYDAPFVWDKRLMLLFVEHSRAYDCTVLIISTFMYLRSRVKYVNIRSICKYKDSFICVLPFIPVLLRRNHTVVSASEFDETWWIY